MYNNRQLNPVKFTIEIERLDKMDLLLNYLNIGALLP